jgi:hypothetical protein
MAVPSSQVIFVDSDDKPIDLDRLVEKLRVDGKCVLADDEVGFIAYVGGMGFYELRPTESSGQFIASPVTQISRPRSPARVLRKQIGASVFSVTADAVFVIREGDKLKKVRAEKLEPGMVLASGEKVFQ